MSSMDFFDRAVKPHLQLAREYAYRTARELDRLPERPAFFTLTQDQLDECEAKTMKVLEAIRSAKATYLRKPVEQDHAA